MRPLDLNDGFAIIIRVQEDLTVPTPYVHYSRGPGAVLFRNARCRVELVDIILQLLDTRLDLRALLFDPRST